MDITLDFGSLYEQVSRTLSIIAKRSTDDQGNRLFDNITLGSREKVLINDYFTSSFVMLAAELCHFVTAEVKSTSSLSTVAYIDWWTTLAPSSFTNAVTTNGQLLYRYDTSTLYQASLSFPTQTASLASNTLCVYNSTYYRYTQGAALTELTSAQVAALTPEQEAAAVRLAYNGVNPSSLTLQSSGIYGYYSGNIWVSVRSCSFSQTTPSATTLYYDPSGAEYQWLYNTMQPLTGSLSFGYTLTVTLPDNWNEALLLSLRKALEDYCVSFALYSWFTVTAPRLSEKYQGDCVRDIASIIRLVNEKKPPEASSVSPLSISTSIS